MKGEEGKEGNNRKENTCRSYTYYVHSIVHVCVLYCDLTLFVLTLCVLCAYSPQTHDFIRRIEREPVDVAGWYGEVLMKEAALPPRAEAVK